MEDRERGAQALLDRSMVRADGPRRDQPADAIPSSSPAFGTAPHPLRSINPKLAAPNSEHEKAIVLPILIPPTTLRPLAFRILTKSHSLTLHSSALQVLATFVGKNCGSRWREDGLASKLLEEVGKTWKNSGGGVIITAEGSAGDMLRAVLHGFEAGMSGGKVVQSRRAVLHGDLASRPGRLQREDSQQSLGMSGLDMRGGEDEGEEVGNDARAWLQVIDAFDCPRYGFSTSKKAFERLTTKPTILSAASEKTQVFRQRYALIHQRLLRNPLFQQSSVLAMGDAPPLNRSDTMSTTRSQTYKLTPISALLGRTGSQHIILGYLSITPTGFLSISDPTGAVMLDIRHCREGSLEARYTPGMVVVVQGLYEEIGLDGTDGSGGSGGLGGQSGVGGLVGGRFTGNEINQPPTESRALSLGLATENVEDEGDTLSSMGPTNGSAKTAMGGFGYFDFSGLGSYRALGERMERISRRVLSASSPLRNRIVVLGECNLDDALTLAAMRRVFTSYATSPDPNDEAALVPIIPLAFVLTGNFTKYPVLAGGGGSHGSAGSGGSVGYKEVFDSLSAILADYPLLLAHSSFIFVPGDNDAWASSYSAGASTVVPRRGVPALFTSRLKRTFATAISESRVERGKGKTGDAIWTTNPSRIGLFGPTQDITVFRDNISSRMRRHGLRLDAPEADMEDADADLTAAADAGINPGSPGTRPQPRESHADSSHRPLLTSLLSQSTLSPFLPTTRPVLWDQITSLSLYPLPNVLILVDPYMRPFVDRFDGCLCLNPGPVLGAGKERWAVMGELTLGATEGTVSARSRINGRIRRLRL